MCNDCMEAVNAAKHMLYWSTGYLYKKSLLKKTNKDIYDMLQEDVIV